MSMNYVVHSPTPYNIVITWPFYYMSSTNLYFAQSSAAFLHMGEPVDVLYIVLPPTIYAILRNRWSRVKI